MSIRRFLLLPHLKIHNANALSSPFTIGFPAMTAWLGFTHALERKLQQQGLSSLIFTSVGVISHQCDLQTYQGPSDFVSSIIGTGNPLDKDGTRSAFIEEARCHLDVSLLIEYEADEHELDTIIHPAFIEQVSHQLIRMKVASGDLLSFKTPKVYPIDETNEKQVKSFLCSHMPGFALVERRELMIDAMENGQDALDALLDYLTVHHECRQNDEGEVHWHSQRKTSGWIVPIATGFHGISPLATAQNQRDPDVPHRFSESVVTLGEFKMVHRIDKLDDLLWQYNTDIEHNLYLCEQVSR